MSVREKYRIFTNFVTKLSAKQCLSIYITVKVKVKVTLVQTLRLCTGLTAYRGNRGIALPFHDHGTRRG